MFKVYVRNELNSDLTRGVIRYLELVDDPDKLCLRLRINLRDMYATMVRIPYEEEWLKYCAKKSKMVASTSIFTKCLLCNKRTNFGE